jgi:short-subunit dehydrogenase
MAKGIFHLAGMGMLGVVPAVTRQLRRISFRNRVVMITGGSRGLGLEIARVVLSKGAIVALVARDKDELQRAKEILGASLADRVFTFPCDVRQEDAVNQTVAAITSSCGQIDFLINDAGVIEAGPMEVQTVDDYKESMDTHFWGPLFTTHAVLPSMKQRKVGRIVNIASIAGLVSVPHLLPYSASKHALVGFSSGLRTELLKDNIYVTTVCPGLMRTGSPVNADMKGQVQSEYALFSLLDSLPFTSIDAATAAKEIVDACKFGDANLVISIQAQVARMVHALAPNLSDDVLSWTNIFLPKAENSSKQKVKGKDSESAVAPSAFTSASDDAAVRNNETPSRRR